ncbi:hypothetical protein G3O08_13845 [Cryomorpha ignava]|uniref:T9SS C-terminal target domain-containing protein n=1 Tax=Cryomorpha ignava TaxID=101383 RepID=A0A7K3WSZ9_9FLAO|nr:hypothetical protein [Cryomorpha ignava]NEN24586.1 hypothetical protein [Cryomorpha ignava]
MKILKLLFTFLITYILVSNVSQAQDWDTAGNSTFPGDFLGTTNNQVLNFKTNSLFRMRLMNSTGYLGVGSQTFTPSASLHLNLLSYNINAGNLIRTDGRVNLNLSWAMYSGTNVGNSVQRARFLLSPFTDTQNDDHDTVMFNDAINHLQIESTLGDIVFQAHGANSSTEQGELFERMRITSAVYSDPHWDEVTTSTTRVSISGRPDREITEPLAMLHIGEAWDFQRGGHREWMNSGVYINRGNDNVFFGMRPRENTTDSDDNDAIIAWGDNAAPPGREDGLRIVFSGPYDSSANPGEDAHLNGLETMRFHPSGNIGMGDFSVNGLDQMPTEKLDIVGRLRVRDVPLIENPDVLFVGREIDDEGDYVLNHLTFPDDDTQVLSGTGEWIDISSTGGADCRWVDIGSGTIGGELDIRMGFDPNSDCYRGKVAIGAPFIKDAKLEVHANFERDEIRTAAIFRIRGDQDNLDNILTGAVALSDGIQGAPNLLNTYVGLSGTAGGAYAGKYNVGVRASGYGQEGSTTAFGVYAKASNSNLSGQEIGVYSEGSIALYRIGAEISTGGPITLSDQSIKADVNNIENAMELLTKVSHI